MPEPSQQAHAERIKLERGLRQLTGLTPNEVRTSLRRFNDDQVLKRMSAQGVEAKQDMKVPEVVRPSATTQLDARGFIKTNPAPAPNPPAQFPFALKTCSIWDNGTIATESFPVPP